MQICRIMPKAAVELVKQAVATRSQRTRRITIRTGRHDTSFVYPGRTFGPLEGKLKLEDTSAVDPALGLQRGSLPAWREGLTNSFRHSDYLIFAASVAFSGPLFDLAGEQEGVVFHFQPQKSAPDNNGIPKPKVRQARHWPHEWEYRPLADPRRRISSASP